MENPTYPAQIAQAYARMAELPPDPWRPAYHLSPLSGTLADPDGLCQVGGVYHIFYVTNPLGCLTTQRTSCVWGHYSTRDFVHYRRETTAIFPDTARDRDGVYSGSALVDGDKLNQSLFEHIPAGCTIRNTMSPVFRLKSVKNAVELDGIRHAMVKDGVALVRFFKWLEENVKTGNLSEISVAEKLYECRAQQELFKGESFSTIAGYAHHGAIVHYSATPESNATILPRGFLLIDSGAQYLDGTTDITRTISLGSLSPRQKRDFTLVMKGHIALATCHFPQGTRGAQLDALARHFLWDDHLNYLHGTGHGVGHFLNVHEGPQNIRLEENPTPLMPGMITSNEPGLYRTGEYGIRCENLILTVPDYQNEFGMFYRFET